MLESAVSVFGDAEDCRKALEEAGCSTYIIVDDGTFRAYVVKLALHNICLLRVREPLARIATYSCASGMRRFVLPPLKGSLACNGIEVVSKTILTHGPGETVFERVSSLSESQCITVPEATLLRNFHALVDAKLAFPRGASRWQPPIQSLRRLGALLSASTGMSVATLERVHGVDSYWGLEQEIITELVCCLADRQSLFYPRAANRLAEALFRAESRFAAIENASFAINELCRELAMSERTLHRYLLQQFKLSPTEYHNIVRRHYLS
jgi:hypothetical protein